MAPYKSKAAPSGSKVTDWVAYLTILGVGLAGWDVLAAGPQRWFGMLLLAGFTLLLYIFPEMPPVSWKTHAYLAVQTLLAGTLTALPETQGWIFAILFFILSSQAATILPSPTSYLWIGFDSLVVGMIFLARLGFPEGLSDLLLFAGGYFFFGAFTYAWTEAETARRENQRLLVKLAEEHQRLQEYAAQVETLTEAQERSRMAREIHDTLGHSLTALDVQLELLKRLPAEREAQRSQALAQAQELVRQGLAETRRAVRAMQPAGLETLSLRQAIEALIQTFHESSGIPVDWQIEEENENLPPYLALPLYRLVQEALTNIRRHAPGVPAVTIRLQGSADQLCLWVSNPPPPAPVERSPQTGAGRGLAGLNERIQALGGRFQAGPTPEGGFRVEAQIPRNSTVTLQ